MSAFGHLAIVANATTDSVGTSLYHVGRYDSAGASLNVRMNQDASASTDTGTMSIIRGGVYRLTWTLTLKSATGAVVYTIMPRRERSASQTNLTGARGEIEVTATGEEEFGAGEGIFSFNKNDEIRIYAQVASGTHTTTFVEGQFGLEWMGPGS